MVQLLPNDPDIRCNYTLMCLVAAMQIGIRIIVNTQICCIIMGWLIMCPITSKPQVIYF